VLRACCVVALRRKACRLRVHVPLHQEDHKETVTSGEAWFS